MCQKNIYTFKDRVGGIILLTLREVTFANDNGMYNFTCTTMVQEQTTQ